MIGWRIRDEIVLDRPTYGQPGGVSNGSYLQGFFLRAVLALSPRRPGNSA